MDRDLLAGTLSPDGSLPGSRIAPNPILLTVRSPSSHVPAAAALITGEFTRPGYAGYTPGSGPVTFEVDGLRFGCAMGIEVPFPEVWADNGLWVSFVMSAQHSAAAPAGIIAPDGRWAARYPADGHPALAIAGIDNRPESIDIAVTKARPWRRQARDGIYAAHLVTDNRSEDRGAF
jgi:predicted amidohydrolase